MRIAYFSPFNPMKSGISDYSEELLPYLSQYMDIDLYLSDKNLTDEFIKRHFKIYFVDQFAENNKKSPYDACLYHIGNNYGMHAQIYSCALKYPGIVVMHDYAIHHMIAAFTVGKGANKEYVREMEYAHGEIGREVAQSYLDGKICAPWENRAMDFPLNRRILESAKGIIVHSYESFNRIKQIRPYAPVKMIHHYSSNSANPNDEYRRARNILGIHPDEMVIASFGIVNEAKRINQAIEALAQLYDEGYNFTYYLVGELTIKEQIEEQIAKAKLPGEKVVIVGHVELDNFLTYMKATDICINLRYPVHGETSGSLHRLLGMAKPVLVSNIGSFKEYPEDVVIKIDVGKGELQQIYNSIKMLINDTEQRALIGKCAHEFAKNNCNIESVAKKYFKFTFDIIKDKYCFEGLIQQLATLLIEMGFNESNSLIHNCSTELSKLG